MGRSPIILEYTFKMLYSRFLSCRSRSSSSWGKLKHFQSMCNRMSVRQFCWQEKEFSFLSKSTLWWYFLRIPPVVPRCLHSSTVAITEKRIIVFGFPDDQLQAWGVTPLYKLLRSRIMMQLDRRDKRISTANSTRWQLGCVGLYSAVCSRCWRMASSTFLHLLYTNWSRLRVEWIGMVSASTDCGRQTLAGKHSLWGHGHWCYRH